MRDWGMFTQEGNKKIEAIYNDFRQINSDKSSYDLWMDVYTTVLSVAKQEGFEEATDSDVTTQLFWQLNDKGIIKLTLDDYYKGIDDVVEKERDNNMKY